MTRSRSRVALDQWNSRCIVFDKNGDGHLRFRAVELNQARRALATDCLISPPNARGEIAVRVVTALGGEHCYALYCHEADSVKIGRTMNVWRRWGELEAQYGHPLQLLAAWATDDYRALERSLHCRFGFANERGEWFRAEPIITELRRAALRGRWIDAQFEEAS